MLIYRGWGFLALLIPIIMILTGIYFFGIKGNASYQIMSYSVLAAAPVTFFIGIWLNKKKIHDLYFIKLHYWGVIWAIVGFGMLAIKYF